MTLDAETKQKVKESLFRLLEVTKDKVCLENHRAAWDGAKVSCLCADKPPCAVCELCAAILKEYSALKMLVFGLSAYEKLE